MALWSLTPDCFSWLLPASPFLRVESWMTLNWGEETRFSAEAWRLTVRIGWLDSWHLEGGNGADEAVWLPWSSPASGAPEASQRREIRRHRENKSDTCNKPPSDEARMRTCQLIGEGGQRTFVSVLLWSDPPHPVWPRIRNHYWNRNRSCPFSIFPVFPFLSPLPSPRAC